VVKILTEWEATPRVAAARRPAAEYQKRLDEIARGKAAYRDEATRIAWERSGACREAGMMMSSWWQPDPAVVDKIVDKWAARWYN
jgi:hypothetical protein